MTIKDFTNKADGLINDFSGGASDEKEFRDGILDLLLEVANPAIQVQAKVMPNEVLVGGNDLATEVKQDIENRIIKGVQTYGERLRPFNGRDALLDAYEECLDQALYLKQELTERQAIQEQAKVIVNFADIENKLKAVTQIVDIGIFAENAMIEGLIADQRVIAYKDALRICKELVSKISK